MESLTEHFGLLKLRQPIFNEGTTALRAGSWADSWSFTCSSKTALTVAIPIRGRG